MPLVLVFPDEAPPCRGRRGAPDAAPPPGAASSDFFGIAASCAAHHSSYLSRMLFVSVLAQLCGVFDLQVDTAAAAPGRAITGAAAAARAGVTRVSS